MSKILDALLSTVKDCSYFYHQKGKSLIVSEENGYVYKSRGMANIPEAVSLYDFGYIKISKEDAIKELLKQSKKEKLILERNDFKISYTVNDSLAMNSEKRTRIFVDIASKNANFNYSNIVINKIKEMSNDELEKELSLLEIREVSHEQNVVFSASCIEDMVNNFGVDKTMKLLENNCMKKRLEYNKIAYSGDLDFNKLFKVMDYFLGRENSIKVSKIVFKDLNIHKKARESLAIYLESDEELSDAIYEVRSDIKSNMRKESTFGLEERSDAISIGINLNGLRRKFHDVPTDNSTILNFVGRMFRDFNDKFKSDNTVMLNKNKCYIFYDRNYDEEFTNTVKELTERYLDYLYVNIKSGKEIINYNFLQEFDMYRNAKNINEALEVNENRKKRKL